MSEYKGGDDSKMFPDGYKEIVPDENIKDKDKNVKEVLSEYNATKGFFKRCEEVLDIISGLFKGLMK